MRIAVTGGVGFVGRNLISLLINEGHDVTVFDNAPEDAFTFDGACYVKSDLTESGSWQNFITQQDAVINLAGVNIFQRWNESRKKDIYDSRIKTTQNVVNALGRPDNQCKILVNASAVGYYGFRGDEEISESASSGDDFLAYVSRDWENEALKAEKNGVRVAMLRFGTVFGNNGGAFPELKRNFKKFLGAKLGSGKQWFPWIHIDDLIGVVVFALLRGDLSGPVNCVSPHALRNDEFTRVMKSNLGRFSIVPFVPGIMLRIFVGEFGSYLLKGQKVVPARLMELGYKFKFQDLDSAIRNLLGK